MWKLFPIQKILYNKITVEMLFKKFIEVLKPLFFFGEQDNIENTLCLKTYTNITSEINKWLIQIINFFNSIYVFIILFGLYKKKNI